MKTLILQVFYQPEGVSLRFYPQPEANAFRLIQPTSQRISFRSAAVQLILMIGSMSAAHTQ